MKTATRTDIHRPSAEEFDPEGYDFMACFDLHPEGPAAMIETAARVAYVNRLLAQGYKFSGAWGMGSCDHCGAALRYAALMTHEATKGMIWVGETCLGNRFSLNKAQFQELRKNAALNRDRMKKSEKVTAIVAEMSDEVRAAYNWALSRSQEEGTVLVGEGPAAYYVSKNWDDCTAEERFARTNRGWGIAFDIASKIAQYTAALSEKQAAFLVKLHADFQALQAKRAEEAAKVASGAIEPAPTGRVQITGEILSVNYVENDFGGAYKMLVKDDRGFKVYGTCPGSIENSERGARVQFTGTVTPSDNDRCFGFFSRPAKAKNV